MSFLMRGDAGENEDSLQIGFKAKLHFSMLLWVLIGAAGGYSVREAEETKKEQDKTMWGYLAASFLAGVLFVWLFKRLSTDSTSHG